MPARRTTARTALLAALVTATTAAGLAGPSPLSAAADETDPATAPFVTLDTPRTAYGFALTAADLAGGEDEEDEDGWYAWGPGETAGYADLDVRLTAESGPLEIRSRRSANGAPITTEVVLGDTVRTLPAGTVKTLRENSDFLRVTVKDGKGRTVASTRSGSCFGGFAQPATPGAADTTPYPFLCPTTGDALGSLQGIARGWSSSLDPEGLDLDVPIGWYRVTTTIAPVWAEALGMAPADATRTFSLRIMKVDDYADKYESWGAEVDELESEFTAFYEQDFRARDAEPVLRAARRAAADLHRAPRPQQTAPRASAPTGEEAASGDVTAAPDLRARPATQLRTSRNDVLSFRSTIWNSGTAPLRVNAFDRARRGVLTAYELLPVVDGGTGHREVGPLVWNTADTHRSWQTPSVLRYTLTRNHASTPVATRTVGSCLQPTTHVDSTLPGAALQPQLLPLGGCDERSAAVVFQGIEVGWGSSYSAERAGNAFNLKGLPNGTYRLGIEANPTGLLTESDRTNNTAERLIRIGGAPGRRTVTAVG